MIDKDNVLADLESIPESYYGFIFHYYRAEVYRETNWRNRLDNTTNWSIVVTAAILSFAFTNENAPHSIILVDYFMVWFFLYIESRRFRYYWHLRSRTRTIEKELLSQIFLGKKSSNNDKNRWKEKLAESFKNESISMSRIESIAWRFRRNYFFIIPLVFASWIAKVTSYPYPIHTSEEFFYHARVWFIPGEVVFSVILVSILLATFIALYIPSKRAHADLP